MPTQQQIEAQARIDARKAQMAQQQTGQDIARANIGNAYVWTGTGENFVYDKTKAPGYVAPVAPQEAAAARLTANGVDPTKLGTGVGENYQPYQVKPIIATSTDPVKSTPSATTPTVTTPWDYTAMTPEQLKAQYMTIGTKLPWEITDEDRRFTKYLQTRMSLGETVDKIFGTNASKSSGTTTYSPQLNHASEQYDSSVKNADGTYTVKYKDGSSQVITEPPTKTIFPEWTPEYFAQKQADEAQIRLDALTEQMKTEEERRKKETADLTAKYGENIATQFATQKADIEANGAKRMDTLNTWLSFSGFGRSTLALEKRDEIAKNIEATVNQAKAKADLELMAFRMEREGADATAIDAMRKNIADVQQKIDDANYANQLEIIKLNQENATTGAEAMNNLLATISDSEQIVSNADIEKSQTLGYFVNKDGSIMLDSQKRPIQFEGNPWSLDPSAIGAYADALNKKIIDEKALDKLSPADKAAVLKHVWVQNGTWTGAIGGDVSTASGDLRGLRSQYPSEAWSGTNNPTGLTVSPSFSQKLQQAGIQFTTKPRPSNEWGEYYVFSDISDGLQAHNIALKTSWWQDVYQRLYKWSAGGTADTPQSEKEANKKAYAENLMRQAGIPMGTKFSEITPEQEAKLLSAHIAKESPNLYKVLTSGQGGQPQLSTEARNIIAQINSQWGKPQDYILGTSADSQKLLQEVIWGLNAQGGTGTLASDTRTQSLNLATDTINNLLDNKAFSWSFRARNDWTNFLWANAVTNFKNDVDKLAGQLLQIDWPTLKAMFWPQISNSDVEAIKRTILQGLNPTEQTPEAFEKTLNDVKNKMQAYLNRLPQNTGTQTPVNNVGSTNNPLWI